MPNNEFDLEKEIITEENKQALQLESNECQDCNDCSDQCSDAGDLGPCGPCN